MEHIKNLGAPLSAIVACSMLAMSTSRTLAYPICYIHGPDVECISPGCIANCSQYIAECPQGIPALVSLGVYASSACTVRTAYKTDWGNAKLNNVAKTCSVPGVSRTAAVCQSGIIIYTGASVTITATCTEYYPDPGYDCGDWWNHVASAHPSRAGVRNIVAFA